MKLLYCPECGDIFSLSTTPKRCSCGFTGGHYLSDRLNAVYDGEGMPLGIANSSFTAAMQYQTWLNKEDDIPFEGAKFEAFFIPANCETFKKR